MATTIVSIATASGQGAIGIVRISGDSAFKIAGEIFQTKNVIFKPRMLYLGNIKAGNVSDQVLMVQFASPNSFTGEDVVEFQCHGGEVVLRSIVKKAIELGAQPATQGEFSQRAFLNGKMNLTQVEGIADIINAESETEAEIAFGLFGGGLSKKVKILQDKLMDVMLYVEASFDYPEEEMPQIGTAENISAVKFVREEIEKTLQTYSYGKKVKEGVKVAIIGNPNVGKSSILNRLCGEERAIVTEIAGTTRDIVEVRFVYKDLKFSFFDTAGIRQTEDIVEKIGVERGVDLAKKADVLLAVFDERGIDNEILSLCNKDKTIVVFNKIDGGYQVPQLREFNCVEISAKEEQNLATLYEMIYEKAKVKKSDGLVLTNERHYFALNTALEMLKNLQKDIEVLPADLIAIDMKQIWETLGSITGTTSSEEIVNAIFSRLCLGK
ncbi:MAG: tRNA uridine-5-carboxymethylaminomethyl(34) synthesis GTPase MnmE [Bacillota bacterium]